MERPSGPLLAWLRGRIDERGENTASVASKIGMKRATLRRMLTGAEPMTVDALLQVSQALEVTPEDLGLGAVDAIEEADEHGEDEPIPMALAPEGPHWRNQPEVLLRVAFEHGIDVMFLADPGALEGVWGGPESVLDRYRDQALPVGLDAAYHPHMQPVFGPAGLEVTLSFDRLYRCLIPWHAIGKVIFTPLPVDPPEAVEEEPEDDAGPGRPHLRLV